MNQSDLIKKLTMYGADINGINDRFMGDTELYEKCFGDFPSEPNFDLLAKAIEMKDYDAAFEAAHALKGLTGNLGLTPLYVSISALVETLRSKDYANVNTEYEKVLKAFFALSELFEESSPEASSPADSSEQPQESKPKKRSFFKKKRIIKKHSKFNLTVLLMSLVLIIVSAVLFVMSNRKLLVNLQQERIEYVDEVSAQLINFFESKRNYITAQLDLYTNSLELSDATSFKQTEALFSRAIRDSQTILLVDSDGNSYTTDGTDSIIYDLSLLSKTLSTDDPVYSFVQGSNGIDYWLFSSGIAPKKIDGKIIVALYIAYDVVQFSEDLRMNLFDNNGYTFLIESDGSIVLRPEGDGSLLFGYNVISSLTMLGLDAETADIISSDFAAGNNNSMFVDFDGEKWLINYKPAMASNNFVFITIPVSAISRSLNLSINNNFLSLIGIIMGLLIIILLFISINHKALREQIRQNKQLEQCEKIVERKNNFISRMSHEIRTPLNAIVGMNYLAIEKTPEDSPIIENLRSIDISSKYLLGIINDILDMSAVERGTLTLRVSEFRLRSLIETITTVQKLRAESKKLEFSTYVDKRLAECYWGDSLRINQILMNLISNAIKFTESGGSVSIRVVLDDRFENYDKLHIIVSDTGIGMTSDYIFRNFDAFSKETLDNNENYGGTGLGLSIVKGIVDAMDGTIQVQSEKGKGTSFDVVLSLQRGSSRYREKITAEITKEQMEMLKGKSVLLAEDNELNMIIITSLFSTFNMKVDKAFNGKEALEKFEASKLGDYDYIVTDIRMPVMDGYILADCIRSSSREDAKTIPIFALSANAFEDDVQKSFSHGINAHLRKPIDVEELKELLCKFIGGVES